MMIDIESRIKAQRAYCERYDLLGKKVKLVSTTDPYTLLKPGETGIINYIDDYGTIHVCWENGSRLGLIPGEDKWEYVNE
jgi:hypothetical protein